MKNIARAEFFSNKDFQLLQIDWYVRWTGPEVISLQKAIPFEFRLILRDRVDGLGAGLRHTSCLMRRFNRHRAGRRAIFFVDYMLPGLFLEGKLPIRIHRFIFFTQC